MPQNATHNIKPGRIPHASRPKGLERFPPNRRSRLIQATCVPMTTSPLADIRAKLAATKQATSGTAKPAPAITTATTSPAQAVPAPAQAAPVSAPTQADIEQNQPKVKKPSRRKWTDDDYRLRGYRTPAERKNDPRMRLATSVSGETFATVRAFALEHGIGLGEAIDQLIERGVDNG